MKNNVAFILFSATAGGAERNAINFQLLASPETRCDIITIKPIHDYHLEYHDSKIQIISLLNSKKKISILSNPFVIVLLFYRLLRLAFINRYDIFIGGSEYLPFYVAVFLAKFLRKKSILIVGNNISAELKHQSRIQRWSNLKIFRLCFLLTNHIISVSHGLTNGLQQDFKIPSDKISTIYNAVDIKHIQKCKKQPLDPHLRAFLKNHTVITSYGRLTYKKGLQNLIRSFSLIHAEKPDTLLLIVGKGELSKELNTLVTELSLSESVKFIGFVPENPYALLSHSDVFVFSSYFEGFGNVLLEALACGLPIVSSNCLYGPLEILEDTPDLRFYNSKESIITNSGILVPPFSQKENKKSEKQFAEAVLEVLSHKKKYTSTENVKRFSLPKMVLSYENIINELIYAQR